MATAPAAPRTFRLFIALWPEDALRGEIASWQSSWVSPERAAPVKPERLHMTLHFIGNVDGHRLPALAAGLQVPFEPITLDLGFGEVWPNGVAVLRPAATPAPLQQLHAALAQKLLALELPVEDRPFKPHVTLARRAFGARAPVEGPRLHWQADQGYVLVRSLPGGAGYQVLNRFA